MDPLQRHQAIINFLVLVWIVVFVALVALIVIRCGVKWGMESHRRDAKRRREADERSQR
jgi:flagellar biosynthesis/type III secretory pathway M-ring protein FliF/YscJ